MRKCLTAVFASLFLFAATSSIFAADNARSESSAAVAAKKKASKPKAKARSDNPKGDARGKATKDKKSKTKPGKPDMSKGVLGAKRWLNDTGKKK